MIGALFSIFSQEYTVVAVYAGLLGGGFPDLDMVGTHRKTLHFPVGFSISTVVLSVLTVFFTQAVVVFLFVFSFAASVHCLMDILGGGKEMRPWRETDERAVYNHVSGAWIRPRRIVYDGSIKDLSISIVSGGATLYLLDSEFTSLVVVLLVLGTVYTALRRWITRQISEEFDTFSSFIQHWLSRVRSRIG